jgi:hypothetical protein
VNPYAIRMKIINGMIDEMFDGSKGCINNPYLNYSNHLNKYFRKFGELLTLV